MITCAQPGALLQSGNWNFHGLYGNNRTFLPKAIRFLSTIRAILSVLSHCHTRPTHRVGYLFRDKRLPTPRLMDSSAALVRCGLGSRRTQEIRVALEECGPC